MRAGDAVRHIPTKRTFIVSAVQGDELVCAAAGDTPIPKSDCEVLGACTDTVHMLTLQTVAKHGESLRAKWAAAELAALAAG